MSDVIHLLHSIDGRPLCWPMDHEGEHISTPDYPSVTCAGCRRIIEEGKP